MKGRPFFMSVPSATTLGQSITKAAVTFGHFHRVTMVKNTVFRGEEILMEIE